LVEDLGDEGFSIIVLETEDIVGDFDQERIEDTLIPPLENVGNFVLGKSETTFQDIVRLSNKLHVAILDTLKGDIYALGRTV